MDAPLQARKHIRGFEDSSGEFESNVDWKTSPGVLLVMVLAVSLFELVRKQ